MNPENFDWIPIWVAGQPKWLRVALNTGCAVQNGSASTLDIVDNLPATPNGYQLMTRDCGIDVFAVADNIDRSGGANPPTDPGAADPSAETDVRIYQSQSGQHN